MPQRWSATGHRSLSKEVSQRPGSPVSTSWPMFLEPKQLSAVLGIKRGRKENSEEQIWGAGAGLLFYFVCLRVLSRDWWNFTEQMFQADIRSPNKRLQCIPGSADPGRTKWLVLSPES